MSTPRPSRASIERDLPRARARIDAGEAEAIAGYAAQLALWIEGVQLDPPMKHRELAKLSQVRTSTVGVALAKAGVSKRRTPK